MAISHTCPPARHLWISVAAYGHTIHPFAARSIAYAVGALSGAGIDCTVDPVCGSAYLPHTRNMMARRFMLSTTATDILMIDADVEAPIEAIIEIARAERPFIGGSYCYKVNKDQPQPQFVIEYLNPPGVPLHAEPDGVVEVKMLPTGFVRMNREVLRVLDKGPYHMGDGTIWRNYFETGIRDTGQYITTEDGKKERLGLFWGEDTGACQEYRRKGGKVFLMPNISFSHWGMDHWDGNWQEWMLSKMPKAEAAE